MKIRILAFSVAWAFCLFGQKHINWQNACFNNPGAPYCAGHDYAIKPGKAGTNRGKGTNNGTSAETPSTTDASGIDWRFADPSADALAVLNCSKLSASPLAHSLIDRLGANQGLSQADLQRNFRALSGLGQVAVSVHQEKVVFMITGRGANSVLPAPETGWKSASLPENALLIGHSDAVDQAVKRLSVASPLGELAVIAQQREADSEFWAAGSAKLAGQDAVTAGVECFWLTALMRDRLTSDTAFELKEGRDASVIQAWMSTLGDAKIDGDVVHVARSMETDETGQSFGQIVGSPLGQRLGVLIQSARNFPVRDTSATVHTKPVIYGLDDGPKEVK